MARGAAEHPAELVMRLQGLPAHVVCQRARVGLPYLRRIFRQGAPYDTAERLSRVIGCPIDFFLRPQGRRDTGPGAVRPGAGRCRRPGPPRRSA